MATRTGSFFAHQGAGVTPDLMTLSKGITGGYVPLAATSMRPWVAKEFEGKGIGRSILESLEQAAKDKNCNTIVLNARENAVGFYEKRGYKTLKPSHLLFNEIQHFEMTKELK